MVNNEQKMSYQNEFFAVAKKNPSQTLKAYHIQLMIFVEYFDDQLNHNGLLICNRSGIIVDSYFNMSKHLPSPFTIFPPPMLQALNSIFWNYNKSKFSFPQLSHRSEHYTNINNKAQEQIKAYFSVPSNYHILFIPNEAVFSAIPFNLSRFVNNSAIYFVNDSQSEFAYKEALKLNPKTVRIDEIEQRKTVAPTLSEKPYYYYTYYNKISLETGNIQQEPEPEEGQILVCNLNYCPHYQKVNVQKHGIIFFESGRGIGITGLCVVIVRKDLVGFQLDTCPDMMCFDKSVTAKSIINTPFTLVPLLFSEYISYCNKQGKDFQTVKAHLKNIKQQYVTALKERTEVVENNSPGMVKFRVSNTMPEETWREYGWKFGEYMTIMLQEQNEGKAGEFVNAIFSQ